jgi:serine/threonine protein kinase
MGAVYKAQHRLMERIVALKVISQNLVNDAATIERFRHEVKAAARLTHPNIVTAYDAEQAGNVHFLIMEFVEGVSLAHVVRTGGPLPIALACDYIRQAALGLQHAHERGMVHRDIKPANLVLGRDGMIKILDFGLARFVSESSSMVENLTQAGSFLGTPNYIAPEQANDPRDADIRADLYSLGCTFYYLLTAQPPFPEGTVLQKLVAHAEQTPVPVTNFRRDIPSKVVSVLDRLIAKKPANRYQAPIEVARVLASLRDGSPETIKPPASVPKTLPAPGPVTIPAPKEHVAPLALVPDASKAKPPSAPRSGIQRGGKKPRHKTATTPSIERSGTMRALLLLLVIALPSALGLAAYQALVHPAAPSVPSPVVAGSDVPPSPPPVLHPVEPARLKPAPGGDAVASSLGSKLRSGSPSPSPGTTDRTRSQSSRRTEPVPMPATGVHGLRADIFKGMRFQEKLLSRVDPRLDWHWPDAPPDPSLAGSAYSIRWTGWLKPVRSGQYKFLLKSADGARLWIDEKLVIDHWEPAHPVLEMQSDVLYLADLPHRIRVDYYEALHGNATLSLRWRRLGEAEARVIPTECLLHENASDKAASVGP